MWILWAIALGPAHAGRDRDALKRAAAGDSGALAELYDRHARLLYSLSVRILQDAEDAQDVIQEVFTQVWQQAGRYDAARGNVAAWLITITRSRAIDRLRSRRARPGGDTVVLDASLLTDPASTQDDQLLNWDRARAVRGALADLPLRQRLAIELAFFEGLTHVEIAERLEIPLGTAKTRIREGLLALRHRLTGAI